MCKFIFKNCLGNPVYIHEQLLFYATHEYMFQIENGANIENRVHGIDTTAYADLFEREQQEQPEGLVEPGELVM